MSALRLSDLSTARQNLVRLCQNVGYGQLIGLTIREGEPVLHPIPTVLVDIKLDGTDDRRPEVALDDFELRAELIRFMQQLDQLGNGVIDRLEVRAGIPRRMQIRYEVGAPR